MQSRPPPRDSEVPVVVVAVPIENMYASSVRAQNSAQPVQAQPIGKF
jgi:hypothetical protein